MLRLNTLRVLRLPISARNLSRKKDPVTNRAVQKQPGSRKEVLVMIPAIKRSKLRLAKIRIRALQNKVKVKQEDYEWSEDMVREKNTDLWLTRYVALVMWSGWVSCL